MENDTVRISDPHLPVVKVAMHSYAWVWRQRWALAPACLILTALALAVTLGREMAEGFAGKLFLAVGAVALAIGGWMLFARQCRAIVLNAPQRGFGFLKWDRSMWMVAWALIKMCVLVFLLVMPAAGLLISAGTYRDVMWGAMASVLTLCVLLFVSMRLTLALPAAAAGAISNMALSWKATRGFVFRLIGTYLLVNLPLVVFSLLMFSLMQAVSHFLYPLPETAALLMQAGVDAMLTVLFQLLNTAAAALSFDALVQNGARLREN